MADTVPQNQIKPKPAQGTTKVWIAVGLLAVLGIIFVTLGNWQLERADERRLIAQRIDVGRSATPVRLSADSDASVLQPWQAAQVKGVWLAQWSVLLDNRNLDGKPGFWLATPLRLSDDTAVLVLRGWVARPIGQYNPFPAIGQSTAIVDVHGEVAFRVPQLYDMGESTSLNINPVPLSQTQGRTTVDLSLLAQRQNVFIDEMSEVTGLQFLPVVLLQTNQTDGTDLERQWPTPSIDADTNIGYAIQWFSFAAIAFGAMGVLMWRNRRREKI
jgi:cytochrome oxidase assembly protein ShyY1